MKNFSRRHMLGAFAAMGGVSALTACSVTTSGGTTTYTVNVAKLLSIISSVESGLTQLSTSTEVVAVIGADNSAKIVDEITKISKVTAAIAADVASTVSLSVAKDWITTAESAASVALTLLSGFQSVLPSAVNSMVQAVTALLPALEALIGAVAAPRASTLSQSEAQQIIAAGL